MDNQKCEKGKVMKEEMLNKFAEAWKKENNENLITVGDIEDLFSDIGYEYIWKGNISKHRWWNTFFAVIRIGNTLFGYNWAETTGDDNIFDKGWTFDPDSICEVEEKTKIVKYYERK